MAIQKSSRVWLWIKTLFILFTIIYLFYNQSILEYTTLTWPAYLILCLLLLVNELFRYILCTSKSMVYNISIILSIFVSGYLLIYTKDLQPGVILYFLFLLSDILIIRNKKATVSGMIALISHICVYTLYLTYSTYTQIAQANYSYLYQYGNFNILLIIKNSELIKILINYIFMAFVYLVFILAFNQIRQKRELENLYTELQDANSKLIDNSEKVKELAVEKERNRIAQDIHDSMGHSLTALIMHQDYLEQIIDKDNEKSKELISKCNNLARQSLADLRQAVYMLKQEYNFFDFINSVKSIINDSMNTNNIDIDFNYTENVDELPYNIKEVLYRTIREALTNCIRHAKATRIAINLNVDINSITLSVQDNGCGVKDICKNIGLAGIEERIKSIGGTAEFDSKKNCGFTIRACIPVK